MSLRLGLRLARTSAALRTYLGLRSPFDDDQDDYWTALPRVDREDAPRGRPTGRHSLPPVPVHPVGAQGIRSADRATSGASRRRSGAADAEPSLRAPAGDRPDQQPRHSDSPVRSSPFGRIGGTA